MGRGRVVDDLRARRIASLARRPPVIDHPTPTPSAHERPSLRRAPPAWSISCPVCSA